MITFNIQYEQLAENTYTLFFGRDRRIVFTDKKKHTHFIAETNRRAVSWYVEINELFIELQAIYRRTLIFIKSNNNRRSYAHELYRVKDLFDNCTFVMDRIIYAPAIKAYLLFTDLDKLISWLLSICSALQPIHKSKGNAIVLHSLYNIENRCNALFAQINNYPNT